MNREKRWQDWVNLMFGLWLVLSPMLSVGATSGPQATNAMVMGCLVILWSLLALWQPLKWQEWVNFLVGLWLLIAPMALDFTYDKQALWNHVVVGALICADALWAAAERPPPWLHPD